MERIREHPVIVHVDERRRPWNGRELRDARGTDAAARCTCRGSGERASSCSRSPAPPPPDSIPSTRSPPVRRIPSRRRRSGCCPSTASDPRRPSGRRDPPTRRECRAPAGPPRARRCRRRGRDERRSVVWTNGRQSRATPWSSASCAPVVFERIARPFGRAALRVDRPHGDVGIGRQLQLVEKTVSLSSTTIHSERTRASAHAAANTRLADPYSGTDAIERLLGVLDAHRVQLPAGVAVNPEAGPRRDGHDRSAAMRAAELTDALAQEQRLCTNRVVLDAQHERQRRRSRVSWAPRLRAGSPLRSARARRSRSSTRRRRRPVPSRRLPPSTRRDAA